jgi:iron complex outermembrane receptor protein
MLVSPAEYDAAPAGFVVDNDEDWSKLTFRAGIDYQYSDDLMTYFMFSRGFKSGGFSSQCTSVATCAPYDEEIADSWEIGMKSMWFENRLRANLALFWVDYDEIQREQVIAVIDARGNPNQETVTTNAGELRAKGVELELTAAPVQGLEITGSVGYTDVEYEEFLTNFAPPNAALIAQGLCADAASCAAAGFNLDALGNDDGTLLDVTRTPEWQVALGATYETNLGSWGDLLFNLNAHWQPESEYSTFNHPRTQYEERFLLNGSITFFDVADRFSLSLYGKNLLEEEYRVTGNSVAGLWNMVMYGAPRQIGVELGFRF